jgi:NAD dependent epimerase/dehydratase family enzyme
MILTFAILLSLCGGASVTQQSEATSSANDLVEAAVQNELNRSDTIDIRWKYLSHKEVDDKSETREVIETKFGEVDRLVSVAGKPLSEAQQRGEIKRILRLSRDADDQRKIEQSQRKDEQQARAFLKMFPSAFRFEVANKTGDLVKVTFTPSSWF